MKFPDLCVYWTHTSTNQLTRNIENAQKEQHTHICTPVSSVQVAGMPSGTKFKSCFPTWLKPALIHAALIGYTLFPDSRPWSQTELLSHQEQKTTTKPINCFHSEVLVYFCWIRRCFSVPVQPKLHSLYIRSLKKAAWGSQTQLLPPNNYLSLVSSRRCRHWLVGMCNIHIYIYIYISRQLWKLKLPKWW